MQEDTNLSGLQTRGSLRIRRQGTSDRRIVKLTGVLDINTAADLRAEITSLLEGRHRPSVIEVDLGGVTFVDSLGLGTLVVGRRICADMGVRMAVRNPSQVVTRLLEVSGAGPHLASS